jgi:hypothetical protein
LPHSEKGAFEAQAMEARSSLAVMILFRFKLSGRPVVRA